MTAGVLPALGAAVAFAAFQLVNARILTRVGVQRGIRGILVLGALALGAVTLLTDGAGPWRDATPRALAMSALAGLVHFLLGWSLLGTAQRRIGAARTGALVGAVPFAGALLALLVLDEPLTAAQVAGLVVVTGGVALVAVGAGRVPGGAGSPVSGVAAALATAGCWSVSPLLIREGLAGIRSPVAAATVGLVAGAAVSSVLLAVRRHGGGPGATPAPPRRLLTLGAALVAGALWLQWTAFGLGSVAVVLVTLQLTPVLVPLLARFGAVGGGTDLGLRGALGVVGIVAGSTLVVVAG